MTNGERVTIQKLYDLVIPIKESIAVLVTKVESIDKNMAGICKDNEDGHEKLEKKIEGKITVKAFATWISITVVILTTIITILEKVIR